MQFSYSFSVSEVVLKVFPFEDPSIDEIEAFFVGSLSWEFQLDMVGRVGDWDTLGPSPGASHHLERVCPREPWVVSSADSLAQG